MSRMEELLKTEVVEWKKLWEITIWDKKFSGVDKNKQKSTKKYHYFFSNEIKNFISEEGTIKILTTNKTNCFAKREDIKKYIKEEEVVYIPGGGNAIVQYYKGEFITSDNRIAISKDVNILNTKYLFYYLQENISIISNLYRGSGIKHPDMSKILEIEIPIPSLKTQEKIVKTLDKFINCVIELQAELQARNKQYNYYRDKLLSEEYLRKIVKKLNYISLGELAKISRGASPRPIDYYFTTEENGIPWIKIGDTHEKSKYIFSTKQYITQQGANKSRVLNKGDFVLSNSMSYGRPYILDIKGAIHDGWASISDYQKNLDIDFLYHYLSSDYVQRYWHTKINSSSVSNLNSEIIKSLPVPLISLEIQKNISEKLDLFMDAIDKGKNNIPKEIEQRKKQYEYYREKLLKFDK